jgi:hypothetical protein
MPTRTATRESQVNTLDTDYRAEVVAAALMQYGMAAEDLLVRRGSGARAAGKDIRSWYREGTPNGQHRMVIDTNREGMYDYMPEGVFHSPTLGGADQPLEDIIARMRREKQAEQDARRFFVPFETAATYTELSALYYENLVDDAGHNEELLQILHELWPLLDVLDLPSARIFIHLLPFFHAARGNRRWFEKCLSAFLGVPVTVGFTANVVEVPDRLEDVLLQHARLGISTVLCGPHHDGNRNWHISIGPVPHEGLARFLPGSALNALLQSVYHHCLPATAWCSQYCLTERNETSFTLTEASQGTYLGYSTFL